MNRSHVAQSVRRILLGAGLALSVAAAAQGAETSADTLSEIVVTGSRVRGEAPVGAAVTVLGRAEINSAAAVTVDRIIQQLPQVFDLGVSENSRGQSGGSGNIVYANSINLRGIGANATLTLVDGHRATSNGRSINPSVLPSLGLERIEIVADGASGVYGSDAIAGVVNLIPRRGLKGGEAVARYGRSADGVFDEYQLGFAQGKVWSSGQAMIAYEHVYRSNLSGDDRNFFSNADQTKNGGRDYRVTTCSPGTITAAGFIYAIPTAGVTAATASTLVPSTSNKCNSITGQDLFPEQKYDSVNATFNQELTAGIELFADGFFSRRDYVRHPANSIATISVPSTNAWFVRPPGYTGSGYTVGYNFEGDLPNNVQTGYAQSWEVTPGVRIKLPHDWQFEALMTYGRTHDEANQSAGINTAALNTAAASSDPATAFDPYGLHRTSAATLALLSNQIFFAPTLGSFKGYEARLNGALFAVPAGEVKLAAGYEGQEIGVDLGSARGAPTTVMVYRNFTRRVDSFYGELSLPLFSAANAVTGFQKLEANIAWRSDRYDDVGGTTNPKFGLNWSPLSGLTLRGSYGTSFRAPLIAEIYGNSNNLFQQNYQNPAGGAPILGSALSGANLDLKPETAKTWSVGADWDATDALRLSVTRFTVDYRNQVSAYLSDLAILTRASQFAGTGIILQGTEARDKVVALLAQGIVPLGAFPGGSANNTTVYVDGRNRNLGRSYTTGYDFAVNYKLPTDGKGTWLFNASGTYFSDYRTAITEAAPMLDKVNQIFNPLRFKARVSIAWDLEPVRAQLVVNRINGYTNTAVTPNEQVAPYTPVDFSLSWNLAAYGASNWLTRDYTVGLEVRNLLNETAPYVNLAPGANGSGGYDATVGNPIGRQYGVSLRRRW
ncbi:MAG: TonB-dependent receptor [Proteobacteria bacterium]|nr:TonB-dependent receptor [Pseudomonadota bacterium]